LNEIAEDELEINDLDESELIIDDEIEDIEPVKEGDPDFHAKRINNVFKQRIAEY
jgi:hypothetical protein